MPDANESPIDQQAAARVRALWNNQAPDHEAPAGPSYEARRNDFVGRWTYQHPDESPTAADAAWEAHVQAEMEHHPVTLAWRARVREREAAERAEAQRLVDEREAALQATGAARLERDKAALREHYLQGGGTPTEFEQAWPELRRQLLERRALEGARQDQAGFEAHVRRLWSR